MATKKTAAVRKSKPKPKSAEASCDPKVPALPRAQRPPAAVTRDLFLALRAPRIGQHNPHLMSNPVWAWLAKNPELGAYMANAHFQGPDSLSVGPGFCNNRFGQSRTELEDGRVLLIGGEHEDHYDPDFFIYNDVIVLHPSGEIDVFGYPHDAFAPTDHHSATLLDERVIIVGGLSYSERRVPDTTRVYSLDLRTMAIAPLQTHGEAPSWIFEHSAQLSDDRQRIVVRGGSVLATIDGASCILENNDEWTLELATLRWTHSKRVQWSQWEVEREDQRSHHLFDYSSMRFYLSKPSDWSREQLAKLEAAVGGPPDLALYDALYTPPVAHERRPEGDESRRVVRHMVQGVCVRYVEELHSIRIIVEGALEPKINEAIVEDVRAKLSALEGTACVARRLQ